MLDREEERVSKTRTISKERWSEGGCDGGSEWMGVGCMKEARCSITSFLSDGFEGEEAEEERLAPRDACGMLTTGRKNSAIQSACLPRAPGWVGKVSAKSKRLPTTLEVPGIPTRRVRC